MVYRALVSSRGQGEGKVKVRQTIVFRPIQMFLLVNIGKPFFKHIEATSYCRARKGVDTCMEASATAS